MFQNWTAKEIRRLSVYAIVGYIGFWLVVWTAVGIGVAWIASHLRWVG